jgi:hypothetical protein
MVILYPQKKLELQGQGNQHSEGVMEATTKPKHNNQYNFRK